VFTLNKNKLESVPEGCVSVFMSVSSAEIQRLFWRPTQICRDRFTPSVWLQMTEICLFHKKYTDIYLIDMSFFISSPIPPEKKELRYAWTELNEEYEYAPIYTSEKRKTSLGRLTRYVNYISFPYAKTALCLRQDDFYTKYGYNFTEVTTKTVQTEFFPFLEKNPDMKALTINSF
jgi:hypothetical protein